MLAKNAAPPPWKKCSPAPLSSSKVTAGTKTATAKAPLQTKTPPPLLLPSPLLLRLLIPPPLQHRLPPLRLPPHLPHLPHLPPLLLRPKTISPPQNNLQGAAQQQDCHNQPCRRFVYTSLRSRLAPAAAQIPPPSVPASIAREQTPVFEWGGRSSSRCPITPQISA